MTKMEKSFLGGRMKQLREKNGIKSLEAMRKLLTASGNDDYRVDNKSTLSRAESGVAGEKTIVKWAKAYCNVFKYSEKQIEQFLRGDKIAVPDTSALLKNPQLIDELSEEYNVVLIADIVLNELEIVKNSVNYPEAVNRHAYEIIKRIGVCERIKQVRYSGNNTISFEGKLVSIAKMAAEIYKCKVDIFTDDAVYSAKIKGDNEISIVHLREYLSTKQGLINMTELIKIKNNYPTDYTNLNAPDREEINSFDDNGYTLIISTIYDHEHSFEEKKAKIQWLIKNGAEVDKRDCNDKYFPPITHAVRENDYEMFLFLLTECNANPNVASKSPYSTAEVRHKNEGNVPLMVAAWEGRVDFLKSLLSDNRTSINQQDSNGFTALIKACANGEKECRDLLLAAGADVNIVDHDGLNYMDWYDRFLNDGPLRDRFKSKNRNKSSI